MLVKISEQWKLAKLMKTRTLQASGSNSGMTGTRHCPFSP